LALLGLVAGTAVLEIAILSHGYVSLTADEYTRTLRAAEWARSPRFSFHGHWLPLHDYLLGAALHFHWDLFWTPRAIVLGWRLLSLVSLYSVTRRLFDERTALITIALVACNPWHVWLGATPLTEMPYIALIHAFAAFFIAYYKGETTVALWLAATSLGLANGFRYESWFFSAALSTVMAIKWVCGRTRPMGLPSSIGREVVALAIVWSFPVLWLLGNWLETGDALYSFHATAAYHWRWHANSRHLGYAEMLIAIGPVTFPLAFIGAFFAFSRREWAAIWPYLPIVAIALLELVIVTFPVPGGGRAIQGTPQRYFAIFASLFAPYAGYLLVELPRLGGNHRWRSVMALVSGLVTVGILTLDVPRAMRPRGGAVPQDAINVGLELRRLWMHASSRSSQQTLLEIKYWDFLGVQVGSGDPSKIILDRRFDYDPESRSILLRQPIDGVICDLLSHDIRYVVTMSDATASVLDRSLTAVRTVGQYRIYDLEPVYGRQRCRGTGNVAQLKCRQIGVTYRVLSNIDKDVTMEGPDRRRPTKHADRAGEDCQVTGLGDARIGPGEACPGRILDRGLHPRVARARILLEEKKWTGQWGCSAV